MGVAREGRRVNEFQQALSSYSWLQSPSWQPIMQRTQVHGAMELCHGLKANNASTAYALFEKF
jgi:Tfp pilus assembly protein PilN